MAARAGLADPDRHAANANAMSTTARYDLKVRKIPVNAKLNVSNFLDYEGSIFTSSTTNAVTNNRSFGKGCF